MKMNQTPDQVAGQDEKGTPPTIREVAKALAGIGCVGDWRSRLPVNRHREGATPPPPSSGNPNMLEIARITV